MDKLKGYCGLDCSKCDAYLATISNDEAKKEEVAILWSKLNGVTITKDDINCTGCKGDGIKTYYCSMLCKVRLCAISKHMSCCVKCPEVSNCPHILKMAEFNLDLLK